MVVEEKLKLEWEVQRPLESASGTILIIKAQSGSSIAPMQSWLVNSTVIAVLQLPRSPLPPPHPTIGHGMLCNMAKKKPSAMKKELNSLFVAKQLK